METLAIVASARDKALMYLRFHPARVALAADPELVSHRAFGIPLLHKSEEVAQAIHTKHAEAVRERTGNEVALGAANAELDRLDGYSLTEPHQGVYTGEFLIDPEGMIRWAYIECQQDGLAGLGHLPSDEELLKATQLLAG